MNPGRNTNGVSAKARTGRRMRRRSVGLVLVLGLTIVLLVTALTGTWLFASARAASGPGGGGLNSGSGEIAPLGKPKLPGNLSTFVKSKAWAIKLGKAFFWDEQVGGDGRVACATCHFSAGVDSRTINTINPGPNASFDEGGPDITGATNFPFVSDDIVGSQGVAPRTFNHINAGIAGDDCTGNVNGTRQVTGKNAPNMIMAIYNTQNFWDGRAVEEFVGTVRGDPLVPAIMVDDGAGLQPFGVSLKPFSNASQEVGPPNNGVEMSCSGRDFQQLFDKLLSVTPLGQQHVASTDSVLGSIANSGMGLNKSYTYLIQNAFQPRFWQNGEAQIENNGPLFWGVAVALYGSTLIPDKTRFDAFAKGSWSALNAQEQLGLEVFRGKGRCVQCHGGPEFTNASTGVGGNGREFANTGVRPVDEGCRADGECKVPTVRNTELTGPYFHNGGYLTLRQVVDFYDEGGDFPSEFVDSQIRPLGLTEQEKADLVAFMLTLTDYRVKFQKKPFDHPSLNPPNGTAIPAVGAGGGAATGTFLGASPFDP